MKNTTEKFKAPYGAKFNSLQNIVVEMTEAERLCQFLTQNWARARFVEEGNYFFNFR